MHKVKMSLALFVTALFLAQAAPTARAGRLPGDTITNSKGTTLQYSVTNCILALERDLAPGCKRTRIIQTAIVGEPNRVTLRIMRWNERWTSIAAAQT